MKGAPTPAEYSTPPLRDMLFALINAEMRQQDGDTAETVNYVVGTQHARLLQRAVDAVRDMEDYWRADAEGFE
jgi:hypothetical protein